jgi:3-oxoadipate enol-lactonase
LFTTIDGRRYFTVSFGAGPRTLLAHSGWIGSWEDWLGILEVLSQSWRTVAYDHRGAGDTRVPAADITRDAMVNDLFRVLDTFAIERCVLGGFSSGTLVTLLAALRQPERFSGLLLLNSSLRLPAPPALPPAAPVAAAPATDAPLDFATRMRRTIEAMTPETGDDIEAIRQWAHHHILMSSNPATEPVVRAAFRSADLDLFSRVHELTMPTLLIHGGNDSFADRASVEYLAAHIPRSKLVVFEDSGHLPGMTRPQEVAAAINDFFGSV